MSPTQIFIAISVAVLAMIAIGVFVVNKEGSERKLSTLAGISFAFVIAGIVFGEDRLVGYSLLGIGAVIAIIDMIRTAKASH